MAVGIGYASTLGFIKEATYRTRPGNPTLRLPFTSESISEKIELLKGEILHGRAGEEWADLGDIAVSGSINTDFTFTRKDTTFFGVDLLLAAVMGEPTYASSVTYLKVLDGQQISLTGAIDKGVSVWEWLGTTINGFKLNVSKGKVMSVEFPATVHAVVDPGTTTSATLTALADYPVNRLTHGMTKFRIGDLADALAGTLTTNGADDIGLSDFTLEVDLGMTSGEYATPDYGSGMGTADRRKIIQPVPVIRKVTVTGKCPRYLSTAPQSSMLAWYRAGTEIQMDLRGSPDATYGSTQLLQIHLPRLKLEEAGANVAGAGPLEFGFKATALRNGGTTAGSGRNIYMVDAAGSKIPEQLEITITDSTPTYSRTAKIWD